MRCFFTNSVSVFHRFNPLSRSFFFQACILRYPANCVTKLHLGITTRHLFLMLQTLLYFSIIWVSLHGQGHATEPSSPLERHTFRSQDHRDTCLSSAHSPYAAQHLSQLTLGCAQGVGNDIRRFNFSFHRRNQSIRNFQDLSNYAQQPKRKLLRTFGTQSILGYYLKADYELAYRDPYTDGEKQQSASTQQIAGRMILQGRWAQTVYKAEWGYFGQEFNPEGGTTPQDQSGGRVSWSWKLPNLEPSIAFSRFSNNVELNPLQPRTITTLQAVSLRWNRPAWPTFIMSYGREHSKTLGSSEDGLLSTFATNSANGKLVYHQPTWETFLQSFFSTRDDQVNGRVDSTSLGYNIGGKFSPFQAWHISPNVGYRHESQNTSNLRTQSFSARIRSSYQIGTFVSFTPDVRYQYRTDNVQNLREESLSATLTSQFTPTDHPMRLSFLGNFNANNDSRSQTAFQTLKLALGLDNLVFEFLNLQPYKKIVRLLIHHTQSFGVSNGTLSHGNTSGMVLLSLFP